MENYFNYFLPIFSFLLVFIVSYAFLQKNKVLGDNPKISILISLILASFFIVEAQLVKFVQFTSSWISVFIIIIFLIFILLSFMPILKKDENPLEFLHSGSWFSWVVLILLIIFFITSATYVFHWTLNFTSVFSWMQKEWFQFILLIIISIVVSGILTKK